MAMSTVTAPNPAEYAGDEVQALVLDPGYSSVRAGFAGEDTPKSIIPSYYGEYNGKRVYGDHVIDLPHENMAINNPMSKDGIVEDWDTAEALWKHSFVSKLTGPRPNKALQQWLNNPEEVPNLREAMRAGEEVERCLEDHPLFMTECGWNPSKAREKTTEIAMEGWGTPAFYLGRSGVMAAFSAGKPTALVIDVGASVVSVTPVHDGIILKKGVMRSNLAGNFVSSQIRAMLASSSPPVTITPHYLLTSKTAVDAGQPAQAVYKGFAKGFVHPQESFRRYQEERVLLEFKESAVQTWPGPHALMSTSGGVSQLDLAESYPGRTFEFPDGFNQLFTANRYRVAESLFDPRAAFPNADVAAPTAEQTIPALVKAALSQVDIDIRPHLLSSVVIVGGTTLLYGFTERLKMELEKMSPSVRVRVHAPGNSVERRFSSWIGGSIMASLGTFHQMWISKKEYDEHGPNIVEKRCK